MGKYSELRDYYYEAEDNKLTIYPKELFEKKYNEKLNELSKDLSLKQAAMNAAESYYQTCKEGFWEIGRTYKADLDLLKLKEKMLTESEQLYETSKYYFEIAQEKVNELEDEMEGLRKSRIPEGKFENIEVSSRSFLEEGFISKHEKLFKECKDVIVCLNEFYDDYLSEAHDERDTYEVLRVESNLGHINRMEEQNLKRRREEILEFWTKIDYNKGHIFKESIESEYEYTASELFYANRKTDEIVSLIQSQEGLSQYEQLNLAFSYVARYHYKDYDKAEIEDGRSLLSVFNSDSIVCAGKSNMLKSILDRLGIPSVVRECQGHALVSVALNDSKYDKYGIFSIDPTNQKITNKDGKIIPKMILFNEGAPIYKDLFVNVDWMLKLSDEEVYYLMHKSGLDKIPREKFNDCIKEFKERDLKIIDKYKSIDKIGERHTVIDKGDFGRNLVKLFDTYGKEIDALHEIKSKLNSNCNVCDCVTDIQNIRLKVSKESNRKIDILKDENVKKTLDMFSILNGLNQFETFYDFDQVFFKDMYKQACDMLVENNIPFENEAVKSFAQKFKKETIDQVVKTGKWLLELQKDIYDCAYITDEAYKMKKENVIDVPDNVKKIDEKVAELVVKHSSEKPLVNHDNYIRGSVKLESENLFQM